MQISRGRAVPQPGLAFHGTALSFRGKGGQVVWIVVVFGCVTQWLLVQGLCQAAPYEWGVTKRHVWEDGGSLSHSFLWCCSLRWLPSWLKYSYDSDCWSKRKSILIPLQHLTGVTVAKQWVEVSDPRQSLTLALAGCERCLVGWW